MNNSLNFDFPLNLPHASRIAKKLRQLITRHVNMSANYRELMDCLRKLIKTLEPYEIDDSNPASEEEEGIVAEIVEIARTLVERLEACGLQSDRMGQFIRNLFECLGHGKEGADISLRAGENPDSLQRPL